MYKKKQKVKPGDLIRIKDTFYTDFFGIKNFIGLYIGRNKVFVDNKILFLYKSYEFEKINDTTNE